MDDDQGSVGLGFVLGFFLGLIGIAIAYFVIKKPLTQKGALYGLGTAMGLGCIVGMVFGIMVPMLARH